QDVRALWRLHGDGPAEVARRHLLLAGRGGFADHDRSGQDVEEGLQPEGRAIRPGLRQGHKATLRADEGRRRGKQRWRRDLGPAGRLAEGGGGRLAADVARLRPEERCAVCHENGLGPVPPGPRQVTGRPMTFRELQDRVLEHARAYSAKYGVVIDE